MNVLSFVSWFISIIFLTFVQLESHRNQRFISFSACVAAARSVKRRTTPLLRKPSIHTRMYVFKKTILWWLHSSEPCRTLFFFWKLNWASFPSNHVLCRSNCLCSSTTKLIVLAKSLVSCVSAQPRNVEPVSLWLPTLIAKLVESAVLHTDSMVKMHKGCLMSFGHPVYSCVTQ